MRMRDGEPPGIVEYEHVAPGRRAPRRRLDRDDRARRRGPLRYLLCGLDVTARKQVEEEIRRSRARIVSASDAERKRLERNLHDGAQQNLVTVTHAIHLAARSLRHRPEACRGAPRARARRAERRPTRSCASSREGSIRRS